MPNDVIGGAPQAPVAPVETTETKAPEAPKDQERWAQLAKKEKQLRMEHKRLNDLRAQVDADRASMKLPPEKSFSKDDFKKQFLQDPGSLGFTAEELMGVAVNSSPQDMQIRQLQAKLAEMEAKQAEGQSQAQKSQQEARERALKQITRDAQVLIDANADAYELVKSTGNTQAVVDYIAKTYDEEGIQLSVAEAAQHVEDYLVDQALSFSKYKKVQEKLKPQEPAVVADAPTASPKGSAIDALKQAIEQKKAQSQKQVTPTLTHSSIRANTTTFSADERRARAIAMIEGKLPK